MRLRHLLLLSTCLCLTLVACAPTKTASTTSSGHKQIATTKSSKKASKSKPKPKSGKSNSAKARTQKNTGGTDAGFTCQIMSNDDCKIRAGITCPAGECALVTKSGGAAQYECLSGSSLGKCTGSASSFSSSAARTVSCQLVSNDDCKLRAGITCPQNTCGSLMNRDGQWYACVPQDHIKNCIENGTY